jgi:hypothetical protein
MRIELGRFLISFNKPDRKSPLLSRQGWTFLLGFGIGKRTFNLGYRSNAKLAKAEKSVGPPVGLQPVWIQSWRWRRWYFVILTIVKD